MNKNVSVDNPGQSFFIGLTASLSHAPQDIEDLCAIGLASCASVLQWDSDGSNFVLSTAWMRPDLIIPGRGRCTFVDPVTKRIEIESCSGSQRRALCQISCDAGNN